MTNEAAPSAARLPDATPVRDCGFYRAFEDRFRGSRELIVSRLRSYLPFIEPLKAIDGRAAVDLGCGRGEWLELIEGEGFDAIGVDIDENMLSACRERGLRVKMDDAVTFLGQLADESHVIVSGFHIAEHLSFRALQRVIEEARRVLKPAGLLILETPNPENFRVSSLSFYFDPTHRHPLPPQLLSFLGEYYGFERVKILRLQEAVGLLEARTTSLDDVLSGVSPDYALIAQKTAERSVGQMFDDAFGKEFGITAQALIERFDLQLLNQTEQARKLAELLKRLEQQIREGCNAHAALAVRMDEERRARAGLAVRIDDERDGRVALERRLEEERNARAALAVRIEEERNARAALEGRLNEERNVRAALAVRVDEERSARAALEVGLCEERNARVAREERFRRFTAPLRELWALLTLQPGSPPRRWVDRALAIASLLGGGRSR